MVQSTHSSDASLGNTNMDPERALIIDDDPRIGELVEFCLKGVVEIVEQAKTAEAGISIARSTPPDVILLDVNMPGCDGFQACRSFKEDALLRDIPVIFLTGETGPHQIARALDYGAMDFVTKPFVAIELQARVRAALRTKRLVDMLRSQALLDPLTGLGNRGALDAALKAQVADHARHASPFAFALIDLDHFKQTNDGHGHMAGDDILRHVGLCLRNRCRPYDVAGRFGGDEFGLLLRDSEAPAAEAAVRRILRDIREVEIFVDGSKVAVSASAGLVTANRTWLLPSTGELLKVTDGALYAAKRAGRDQLICMDPGTEKSREPDDESRE
ncbi:MAG: diguanylate cyclase [bacterium]|nr:diguanylate cyclase [bacterium]